jgi:hypothetical protein
MINPSGGACDKISAECVTDQSVVMDLENYFPPEVETISGPAFHPAP